MTRSPFLVVLAALVAACGGSSQDTCNPVAQTGCDGGRVCEAVPGASPACFSPVVVRGTVSDLTTAATLDGARVVALDANGSPLSKVSVTAGGGVYALAVPAPRDSSGKPVQTFITLRADSQGYQTFPGGVRVALPIDLSSATPVAGKWEVSGPLTALELIPLSSGGTAFIHGSVARQPAARGSLVVAEPEPGGAGPETGVTGVADQDGNYAIFNLTAGIQYVVTAYARGANYVPVTTAALASGDNAVPTLALGAGTGASFSGNLIYNNGATSPISVTLVVESTYVPNLDRGESPPGLTSRASNAYSFTGVPDGKYVVLAAFGYDGNVRDVSGTGNTAAPLVTISGGAVVGGVSAIPGFKICPAVDLVGIEGTGVSATPVAVTTSTPTFTWQKGSVDAQASTYRVRVFDSIGNEVWSPPDMAAVQDNSTSYSGSPLEPGMYYQLRIVALKEAIPVPPSPTQLSQSEDVTGVFVYRP